MRLFYIILFSCNLLALDIIDKPIIFDDERIELTKEYIHKHYGHETESINIVPRFIVIHWTAINDLKRSFARFLKPRLPSDRADIQKASALNVSAHFLVDRDGTVYRLMDETMMARHVIGLNLSAIGIENVGGENNIDNLTSAQLKANIALIRYLHSKYDTLDHLIGHDEYSNFTKHPLWLEKDEHYRTVKFDPGEAFMSRLRSHFPDMKASN